MNITDQFRRMYRRSETTLTYRMMPERYPNLKEKVGSSNPGCKIFSLLDGKLARCSTTSCTLTLACRPSVSKINKQINKKYTAYLEWRGIMWTPSPCKQVHLKALGPWPIMPRNLPGRCHGNKCTYTVQWNESSNNTTNNTTTKVRISKITMGLKTITMYHMHTCVVLKCMHLVHSGGFGYMYLNKKTVEPWGSVLYCERL